jgi:hypothetical protein
MNGYRSMADSYRKVLETDKNVDREYMERKITALEIMANTDRPTQYEIFNSSAFNDVIKGYIVMALDNLKTDGETHNAILREVRYLLDTVTAEQAERYYMER